MKAKEVYSQLSSELGPWFKSCGFKRTSALLSWSRPVGNGFVVVWCQVSQWGWDAYAGSQFIVEFQKSAEPIVGTMRSRRERLPEFLSPLELEQVRTLQNQIISELRTPSTNHPLLNISQDVKSDYIQRFEPIETPYSRHDDIWLRFAKPADLSRWSDFIRERLPRCVAQSESWAFEA